MSDPPSNYAFCPQCVKNVPHFRRVRSRWLAPIDRGFGWLLQLFRIGPWYCLHCERRTLIRKSCRTDAPNYRIVDPSDPLPDDSSWTRVKVAERQDASAQPTPTESVGNFIKSEKSLVLRQTRLLRFSEKYRDAVVDRLLYGDATVSELRYEKNLSERELLDWVADRMERLEQLARNASPQDMDPPLLEIIPSHRSPKHG